MLQEVALAALVPGDGSWSVSVTSCRWTGGSRRGAVLDRSSLTGEALPVTLKANEPVLSGTVNAGTPFTSWRSDPRPRAPMRDRRLVEAARAQKAPMARLADRYGLGFLALTLALAGGAWAATGDPIRALAVLVVATPCPLILAVPVALVSGLSRAAGIAC